MQVMQNPILQEGARPKRPSFLTVLCILTFIGSSFFGIISNINSYLTADTASAIAAKALEDAQEKLNDSGKSNALVEKIIAGASVMQQPEKIKQNALFGIVAAVFTLTGAILMFKQKKIGFWTYILGTIVAIIAPFVVFGMDNWLAAFTSSLMAFTGVIFVILYALNLKYMY